MKKILFTDLDGTLLNNEKLVSEGNRSAIQRLLDAGHYLVITTGRPVKSAFQVAKDLGLAIPGCFLIAYNGGVIFDYSTEELLLQRTIPMEHVRHLFAEAKEYGIYIQTYGEDDKILTEQDGPELKNYVEMCRGSLDYEVCEDVFQILDREPYKVLLIATNEEKLLKFWSDHKEWQEGKCESTFSSRELLEYLPANVSKGSSIYTLCEMLGVSADNSYAAGDERNDVSMIEAAGVGIAMKNAVEEAKAVADYITENDNDHDGIAEIIDKLILG